MNDWMNCTGVIEPDKMDGKALAGFRVYKKGGNKLHAIEMDADRRTERRMYLRKTLLNYQEYANLSNDELDQIRLNESMYGYLLETADGIDIALQFGKVTEEETEFRKVRAEIPFAFMNLTGKDFQWDKYKADTTSSKNLINKYILQYEQFRKNGMGLYVYSGTKGSGKTMLACCLLNEITKRYPGSVKFVNVLDFIEMTKKGFEDKNNDVESIYQAKLLVLDDIGVQMSKDWVNGILYRLVNERFTKQLPTIYTSNIPVDCLKIDDRIIDRIESTTYLVALPEEPIRRDVMRQKKDKLLEELTYSPGH